LLPSVFLKVDTRSCTLSLLKKNDGRDALKREGNTTHICAYNALRSLSRHIARFTHIESVAILSDAALKDASSAQMLLNHYYSRSTPAA